MLDSGAVDIRKVPSCARSLNFRPVSVDLRRDLKAVQRRWDGTIWPVLAKYMEGRYTLPPP